MPDAVDRQRDYRRRRRHGLVLVAVEVGPSVVEALRQLDLVSDGEPDRAAITAAVQRFTECAPVIAAIPARLYRR